MVPVTTGSGASAFVIDMSVAGGRTRVTSVLLLLAGFGSAVGEETVAVFTSVDPLLAVTVTLIVTM